MSGVRVFVRQLEPVADSLSLSALVAALPLVTVLVLLGGVRMRAHYAGPIGLAVAALVAWLPYGMPVGQTLSSAAQGTLFGLFPIMWIVVNALWAYRMTVRTDHFDVLRRSFGRLSDDPRVQALRHRLLLRRAPGGVRRVRRTGGDLLGHARGVPLRPGARRRCRARRQHRAREGDLLRKVLPWSLALLLVMCLIVVAQSSFLLSWTLP